MSKPWPIDVRLSTSDIFHMIEAFEKDPKGYSPAWREALTNDPYGRHVEAQIEATTKEKPTRRR